MISLGSVKKIKEAKVLSQILHFLVKGLFTIVGYLTKKSKIKLYIYLNYILES